MSTLGTLDADYASIIGGCGLIGRSERGKLALTGAGGKTFLHGQVSNDTEALASGTGCYAAFLTPKGKMLGDVRILDAGDEILLDTERVALQELFNMVRRFSVGYDVEVHKRTLQSGLISLLGPDAASVAGAAELGAAEHDHTLVPGARAIRTDVGVDLLCAVEDLDAVRDMVLEAGALTVSEAAAECLRIEHGRPRYGVDLDDTVIPQEAGLNERAVSFTKGCYVGQETVARLFYRGKPNRQLRGLVVESGEPIAVGSELTYGERTVGRVTSAALSPRFGSIALAFVRREVPLDGLVGIGDGEPARLVELPFG